MNSHVDEEVLVLSLDHGWPLLPHTLHEMGHTHLRPWDALGGQGSWNEVAMANHLQYLGEQHGPCNVDSDDGTCPATASTGGGGRKARYCNNVLCKMAGSHYLSCTATSAARLGYLSCTATSAAQLPQLHGYLSWKVTHLV